ncbi:MAG: MFS transporter [Rhodospirillaceae bacterium]|nr:MFS transporter [Rhodospirillaceae bacterium]MBT5839082.1 MFS transporter [Rhodospirillaceae bacterium]MBT7031256.1 MFS transporter [Rhodospirillaceae bacterium]MBT7568553.1 MFS transporter [Rhodospirillaceae bacterium]
MVGAKSSAFGGISRALSSRNFVLYCSGLGVALTGTFVFFVALGWVAWEMTHSAAWVGGIVLAETLPNAIVGPFAGVIIDRTSARRALFWAQFSSAVVMVFLTIVTLNDWLNIEILLVISVVLGTLNGIAFPAHFAIMPKLVPRKNLSAAIAFQSSTSQAARFLGPAIAGVIIVWAGAGMAFAFNSVTFIAFLVALAVIRVDESRGDAPASRGVVLDMAAGLQYAWSSVSIRLLLVVAVALGIFLRPLVELMPAYVGKVLEGDAAALAWLLASVGAGAVLASLWLAWRGTTRGLTRIMLWNFAVTVIALIAFLFSSGLAIGVALLFAYGFCSSSVLISNQTLIQSTVDDHLRARIMSIYSLTVRAIPAFGAFVAGQLADRLGIVPTFLGSAIAGLLFWIWISRMTNRKRIAERIEAAES